MAQADRRSVHGRAMKAVSEPVTDLMDSTIDLDGHAIRVWRKGKGPTIGYFAGWGGLPRWTPFLEELARHRTVIAPSLPGFPGGGRAQLDLDTHLDWVVAARGNRGPLAQWSAAACVDFSTWVL